LVVKHRQLACQVGTFGAIAIKSSTDFDNMIFLMRSIFIFRSWVCEADDKGNLHGHLVEALEAHEDLTLSTKLTEDLKKLTVSESAQALTTINLDLTSESDSLPNQTPEHGINSTRDQFISTSGFFQEIESLLNRT
jgi:hypothetical protein